MQEIKNKIEAVLFITGRFMSIEDIAQFCNIGSIGTVKEAMKGLQKEYSTNKGSLEIIEQDGGYKLNIKKSYTHLSRKLLSSAELDAPTQATLAIIAYKQPALQSEIVKMRGGSTYDHIKTLRELDFITSERKGRSRLLKLAPKFYEYFDVVEEKFTSKLRDVADKQDQLLKDKEKKEKQKKIVEEQKEIEEETKQEEVVEEVVEVKKALKVIIKSKDQIEDIKEVERTPEEVLVNIDADDFGS
jgi:segregation and condensation protein B